LLVQKWLEHALSVEKWGFALVEKWLDHALLVGKWGFALA
jgi:hypothetical protein